MNDNSHVPVMLDEVLTALQPRDGGLYVDGTLGAPSSADSDGAKCVGVGVSAQRTRRGSQPAYTCRLSSSGCPPLLLTLSPSSGPARFAYYGACRGRARPFGRL